MQIDRQKNEPKKQKYNLKRKADNNNNIAKEKIKWKPKKRWHRQYTEYNGICNCIFDVIENKTIVTWHRISFGFYSYIMRLLEMLVCCLSTYRPSVHGEHVAGKSKKRWHSHTWMHIISRRIFFLLKSLKSNKNYDSGSMCALVVWNVYDTLILYGK